VFPQYGAGPSTTGAHLTGANVTVGEPREISDIPRLRGRVEPLPDGSFVAMQVPPDVGTVTELRWWLTGSRS
jgi:hypothetical protein